MVQQTDADDAETKRQAWMDALARLGPTLERLVVSAEITATGELKPVGGITEKLRAVLEGDKLKLIHAVGLAADQTTPAGDPLESDAFFRRRLLGNDDYDSHCRQPIVAKPNFCELAVELDKSIDADKRFGYSLPLPNAFRTDEKHYGAARYVPIPWLNKAIREFVEEKDSGYVIIAADAVWGKTSFALNWYRQNPLNAKEPLPELTGAAFIRIEQGGDHVRPETVLEGLEREVRWALNLPRPEGWAAEKDMEQRFQAFLKELGDDQRKTVLLLDGVDEIWGPTGAQPSTLLPGALPKCLPQGVFVVLLSRPGYYLRWSDGTGRPDTCLWIDLSSAAEDKQWWQAHRERLAEWLRAYADRLEREGYPDAPALLRDPSLSRQLLDAAQDHLFVLRWLLEDDEDGDLPERLRRWQAHPELLPKGATSLIASVLWRIGKRLAQARKDKELRPLDTTYYEAQVLACLALAAVLRQTMTTAEFKALLFDDRGEIGQGTITLTGRCADLRWDKLNEDVLDAALRLGAECFAGSRRAELPATTTFWHPRMRDAVRAAWRLACAARNFSWPEAAQIAAEMERTEVPAVTTAEQPLQRWLAAAASRYWPPTGTCAAKEGEARCYALAWGAWHATQTGDEPAAAAAAHILTNAEFLQAAYSTLGSEAHYPLDTALNSAEQSYPTLAHRLFDVRRTLAIHDRALAAGGVLPVAAALYNDMGGHEDAARVNWHEHLARLVVASQGLHRQRPGEPSAFYRFLDIGVKVYAFALSPCGRWLAVPVESNVLLFRLHDGGFRVGKPVRLGGHWRKVTHVAFSAPVMDGKRLWLASASWDGVGLCALDVDGTAEGKTMTPLTGPSGTVTRVAFSAPVMDGKRLWLASACENGYLGLCALNANGTAVGNSMTPLEGHSDTVKHVAFSEPVMDGKRLWLASASDDGRVGLCALDANGTTEGKTMKLLEGHSEAVNHVTFSAPVMDGRRLWLASASWDGHVGLCALDADGTTAGKAIKLLEERLAWAVFHVAFSAPVMDGKRLWLASASANHDVGLCVIEANGTESDRVMTSLAGHSDRITHVAFSAPVKDGKQLWLASASNDGHVGLCALDADGTADGNSMTPIEGHSGGVKHVAFSMPVMNDKWLWLASASEDGYVGTLVLNANGAAVDKTIKSLKGHSDRVNHVGLSAPVMDGRRLWLASASSDGHVGLCPFKADGTAEGKGMSTMKGNFGEVIHVALSSPVMDGNRLWLASAFNDGRLGLCALDADSKTNCKGMTPLNAHASFVNHVTFSAPVMDGKRLWLASASMDDVGLCALEANGKAEGNTLMLLKGHSAKVNHVAFSTPVMDGKRLWLASASADDRVGLIAFDADSVAASKTMRLLKGHCKTVSYVAFSGPVMGGKRLWLASAAIDGRIGLCALDTDGAAKGKSMSLMATHSDSVNRVAFSAPVMDGKQLWLASASKDGRVGLAAIEADGTATDKTMTLLDGHSGCVNLVAFSNPTHSDQFLLASAANNEIILWCIPDGRLVARASFAGTGERIHEIRWSEDNGLLYVAGSRGNVPVNLTLIVPEQLFDPDTPRRLK